MAVVAAKLRWKKICIYPNLDEWLMKTPSSHQTHLDFNTTNQLIKMVELTYQPQEVDVSSTASRLPRNHSGHMKRRSMSFRGNSVYYFANMSLITAGTTSNIATDLIPTGIHGIMHLPSPQCTSSYDANTRLPRSSVIPMERKLGRQINSLNTSQTDSDIVALEKRYTKGNTFFTRIYQAKRL